MNATTKISAFKTGNSVAVRLPKALGVKPGDTFELVQKGNKLELRPILDPEHEKAQVKELVRRLRELGPVKSPQLREPIEFPDRPGLY